MIEAVGGTRHSVPARRPRRRYVWTITRLEVLRTSRQLQRILLAGLVSAVASGSLIAPARAAVAPDFVGVVSEDAYAGDAAYKASTFAAQRNAGVGLLR